MVALIAETLRKHGLHCKTIQTNFASISYYERAFQVARSRPTGIATTTEVQGMSSTITRAIRDHLSTLTQDELLTVEHRAQIRLANASQGVTRIAALVRLRTLPQSSWQAAEVEWEAAVDSLRLVHEAQATELARRPQGDDSSAVDVLFNPATLDALDALSAAEQHTNEDDRRTSPAGAEA
jgi:hypothetical protein